MSAMLDSLAPDVDLTADPVEEVTEVAPVVEQKAAEETKPEVKVEQKEAHSEKKMVPIDALHEERMRRREVERESAEKFKKLEERLERLANPPPPVPKFEEDPAGHLRHQVETTQAELQAIRQSSEQSRQAQEAAQLERQIQEHTTASEQIFAKEHPDYIEAVKHLQSIADKNLQMMGMEDPAQRLAQIRQDALAMSFKALQMGKSPAEVAYNLAVNYGYRAAQPEQKQDAAKKVEAIQEGQKTASMPAGGTKQTTLTLDAIAQMDDDEFNQLVDDPAAWKKLVRQMG